MYYWIAMKICEFKKSKTKNDCKKCVNTIISYTTDTD